VAYPPGAEKTARSCLEAYPGLRARAAAWLGMQTKGSVSILLVEDHPRLVSAIGASVPLWAVAVTRGDGLIALRLDRVGSDPAMALEIVLLHEAVHELLNRLGGNRMPAWFEEGLCVTLAGTPYLRMDGSAERRAAAGSLPSFVQLDGAFRRDDPLEAALAYEVGRSAAAFFLGRHGQGALPALVRRLAAGEPFAAAFHATAGESIEEFEQAWRASITPGIPFFLYVILQEMELALLFFGALLVAAGFLRYRIRRRRALEELGADQGA